MVVIAGDRQVLTEREQKSERSSYCRPETRAVSSSNLKSTGLRPCRSAGINAHSGTPRSWLVASKPMKYRAT